MSWNSIELAPVSTYNVIYQIVRQIPKGKVATYGQVADLANLYGKARLVGYALYRVDISLSDVPWHRVINAKGEISQSPSRYGADNLQLSLLEQEGIKFNPEGKINLREYLWQPSLSLDDSGEVLETAITNPDNKNSDRLT
ncbi:MGMT family protein [Brasilonema sp. UFV-L1]|uniref:MGMT family protein n=1 Tax=Brasilonema sp. UFV-L1 TaxID=2234130 RepID=UPI00145C54DE|nr:MGMT family protein [Brasilonema sp. UFV-L1]NMG06233.1 methyltransferase [Brasilonema sp. UFV-L1]